jgi:hypothetical protein
MTEIGAHEAARASAHDLFAGDQVDAGPAPLFLFFDERFDVADL